MLTCTTSAGRAGGGRRSESPWGGGGINQESLWVLLMEKNQL
jgi:hypothetical protein